jgi:threonyl-tRNA synthetase
MNLPERFDISYVDETGARDKRPVMLHRALFGSLERFIGILIENYEGAFPFWLAPEQAVVINITDSQADYVHEVTKSLQNNGFRAISDLRNEKIGFKIRGHSMQRVPFILVVGEKEKASRTVAVRTRDGDDLGSFTLDQVINLFTESAQRRGRSVVETE